MLTTTNARTASKLEPHLFDSSWLRPVIDDLEVGLMVECSEEIAYVNHAYARVLGYDDPEQLLNRHLSLIVADRDAPRLLEFSRTRAHAEPAPLHYDFSARRRDGSPLSLTASVSTSTIDGRCVISTMIQPVNAHSVPHDPVESDEITARLSPREIEIMEMTLAGKRSKEIAFTLQLSPKTVSTHRHRLLRKLNLNDNRDLFQFALRHHLIDWS